MNCQKWKWSGNHHLRKEIKHYQLFRNTLLQYKGFFLFVFLISEIYSFKLSSKSVSNLRESKCPPVYRRWHLKSVLKHLSKWLSTDFCSQMVRHQGTKWLVEQIYLFIFLRCSNERDKTLRWEKWNSKEGEEGQGQ